MSPDRADHPGQGQPPRDVTSDAEANAAAAERKRGAEAVAATPGNARPGGWAVLIGLLLTPAAWFAQTNLGQTISAYACFPHGRPVTAPTLPWLMHGLLALSVLTFIAGAIGVTVGPAQLAAHGAARHRRSAPHAAASKRGARLLPRAGRRDFELRVHVRARRVGHGADDGAAMRRLMMARTGLRGWLTGGALAVLFAALTMAAMTMRAAAQSAPAAQVGASNASSEADANTRALIERGAYLAKAADCAGCHTAPPSPSAQQGNTLGPPPFAGGLGMASPFGTIYSSNITPDPVAGIGLYTFDDFDRAVREGIAPGNKRLYPAMPYPSFAKLSDDDMHALYAYFMHGVQPVATLAPRTQLPFPFNQRWVLATWDWLLAPKDRYQPDRSHDAQWNRGAYLVQSLGHCGACHTPRGPAYNELGYTQSSPLYLTGGTNDHWFAPNLSGDPGSGLGRVSAQDIASFLKRGHGGGLVTFGSMVQVVEDSTQYLNDDDLDAIATYLKSLPPHAQSGRYDTDPRAKQQTAEAIRTGDIERPGAGIYQSMCARCHKADGGGEPLKYPRLAGNPAVLASHTTSLVRLLVEGGRSPATDDGPLPRKMPAFAGKLTDTEMARVLTYVRSAWGNDAEPVTTRDVSEVRSAIHK